MNNDLKDTKPSIKQTVETLVEQGSETIDAVKTRAGDVADQVKDTTAAAYDRTTNYIQAHPLKSLAIAFGAGYLSMRIKTSPLFKVALFGGLAYLGTQFVRR